MKIIHPDVTCSYIANSFKIERETDLPGQKMFYKIFALLCFIDKKMYDKKKDYACLAIDNIFTIYNCRMSNVTASNCT